MEEREKILLQIIESQAAQIAKLTERVDELVQKLNEKNHRKNSKNSSAPPSSDSYAKPAPKNLRKASGAKAGGQDGHKGNSMKLMKEPDEVLEHYPIACAGCPNKGVYNLRYDSILADGFGANPVPARPKWKRGRPGKGKILSLLERLRDYKADILRFAADWSVPFTNNEAERTIRFSKVKQKVSGCFRTIEGAEEYARIMSYISTARKQGMAYFESVKQALSGNDLLLAEQWV